MLLLSIKAVNLLCKACAQAIQSVDFWRVQILGDWRRATITMVLHCKMPLFWPCAIPAGETSSWGMVYMIIHRALLVMIGVVRGGRVALVAIAVFGMWFALLIQNYMAFAAGVNMYKYCAWRAWL